MKTEITRLTFEEKFYTSINQVDMFSEEIRLNVFFYINRNI